MIKEQYITLLTRLVAVVLMLAAAVMSTSAVRAADETPRVLSVADTKRYVEIFRLQQRGDWQKADGLIGSLQDQILMGHVLYQRYLHPRLYRARYAELHEWMNRYADHPRSDKVRSLALKRRPDSGWKPLRRSKYIRLTYPKGVPQAPLSDADAAVDAPPRTAHDNRVLKQVRANVRRERMTVTEDLLDGPTGQKMTVHARAEARAKLARGHLSGGRIERALVQGDLAARGQGGGRRLGAYHAGIALWALDRRGEALIRFRSAAETAPDRIGHIGAAVDYWHARAALDAGNYIEALIALRRAAAYPRDLYGMIAMTQLAMLEPYDWGPERIPADVLAVLKKNAGVRRAIALAEVGQHALADMELKRLSQHTDAAGAGLLIRLAAELDAPAAAFRMARVRQRSFGEQHDIALYPLPDWRIEDDHAVGRALVLAVARRESGFNPQARSHMGARGLMQLMPQTARYVAAKANLKRVPPARLHDPEVSLEYGQAYLAYLSKLVQPRGGLVQMLAAYNAGPGNLANWKKRFGDREDPLLFIDLMGSRETRQFVKDVLPAFWIYRHRLDLPTPALDQLAQGRWPIYIPPGNLSMDVATGDAIDAN